MSDLSQAVTTDAATGDHPLVNRLRERHAQLSARDTPVRFNRSMGPLRPFELVLPDGTVHVIGSGGPAFTIRAVTGKGLAALSALDELAVAEAYMGGDLDIEGDLLAALKHRPVLADPHPFKYLPERPQTWPADRNRPPTDCNKRLAGVKNRPPTRKGLSPVAAGLPWAGKDVSPGSTDRSPVSFGLSPANFLEQRTPSGVSPFPRAV